MSFAPTRAALTPSPQRVACVDAAVLLLFLKEFRAYLSVKVMNDMSALPRRFTAPSHYDSRRTEVVATREPLVTSLKGDVIDHLPHGSEQVVLVNTAEVRRRFGHVISQ